MFEKVQNPEPEPTPEPKLTSESDVVSAETSDKEVCRKRKRGRPSTTDKSVGTGPSQPPVNKAVQVERYKMWSAASGGAALTNYLFAASSFFIFT